MDEFLILLQAKLDEAKSKSNVNADIDKIQNQLDKLKIQAEIDPKTISNLTKQLEGILNQKIVISEIGINSNNVIKAAQQTGQKIGNAINQGVTSTAFKANKVLKSFTELKIGNGNIDAILDKDGLLDIEQSLNKVKQIYSEFGQVKITNKIFDPEGNLQQFRVDIQQVNGELKESRNFMMALSSDGKSFGFPQDIIKGSENFVHHLNEAKNISNVTGEELNAQKEKLAEQEKYYNRLEQVSKEQLAIEKQRITAGEKQLEILDAQSKRRDSRISYNEKQIDKKGLSDASKQRKINDLSYSGNEKIDASFAKEIDKNLSNLSRLKIEWQNQGVYVDKFKTKVDTLEKSLNEISIGDVKGLNTFKEQISSLSNEAKQLSQINKIQLLSNGGIKNDYSTQIAKLEGNFRSLGLTEDEIQKKTTNVVSAFDDLKTRVNKPFDESNYQEIISLNDKLQKELIESTNEYTKLQSSTKGFVSMQQRLSKANAIETWNQKNTAATKDVRSANEAYIASLRDLNSQMTKMQFNEISDGFKKNENSMRALSKLGASFKDQMSQAAQSFTQWLSVSSGIMLLISKARNAVTELKDINSILTEISKTADQLSKFDLVKLGISSFGTAGKYGKKASDYLTGIQEMYRAGYKNAEDLAELSTLAQSAGDMEADLANDYLIATDAAYKLKGNTEALNEVLDGQNYITNRNALSMKDLAEATKIAASQSASSGIAVDKATAAMGTMIATTRQGGDVAARAWKGILMNLQQVKGEVEDGEILDEESLSKYEKACEDLGVSIKEVKNGVLSLRDPMQILEELSKAYTALDKSDARRANLISAVGGKYRGNQLNALLENWSLYEKMLNDYAEGSGSAMEEAMKSANNWEGSMNRLGNTFTKVVNNIVKSDAVIAGANLFNGLLSGIDKVTSKLGSLGTIGLGAGLFAGVKNIGKCRISVRIS